MGTSLVTDEKWQQWANELVKLQNEYQDTASKVIYAKDFEDFDGTTGFNLPYRDDKIINKAYQLLRYKERM